MPSKGLRLPILLAQKEVYREASPAYKISPMGTLGYALNQATPSVISQTIDNKDGYIKDAKIRFKKRAAPGTSVTADDCSLQTEPAYYEQTIPALLKRYKGVWFDMPTIKAFTEDALKPRQMGTPATQVMQEVMDEIMVQINGLMMDINADVIGAIAFGANVGNGGLLTSKSVNFPQNLASMVLASGMNEVTNDAMLNEIDVRKASIIGSGVVNLYYLSMMQKFTENASANPGMLPLPKFFFDPAAATAWGANQFALLEQDAVQFVNICQNRAGNISGAWGNSEFGTITFPVADPQGNSFRTLEFDWQAKEVDCPANQVIGGNSVARGRGLSFTIGCNYGVVQLPTNAYEAADRLTGVRGVTRYTGANT